MVRLTASWPLSLMALLIRPPLVMKSAVRSFMLPVVPPV